MGATSRKMKYFKLNWYFGMQVTVVSVFRKPLRISWNWPFSDLSENKYWPEKRFPLRRVEEGIPSSTCTLCVHVSVLLARTAACPLSSHPTFCAFSCRGNGEAECGSQAAQGLQHWLYWLHKGRDCRPPRTASGGGRFKQPHDITLLSQIDPPGTLPSPSLPPAYCCNYFLFL